MAAWRTRLMFIGAVATAFGQVHAAIISPSGQASLAQWHSLNQTVGGRLQPGVPVSSPCFSILNGQDAPPNPTACAAIQENYTNPVFRQEMFGAYMMPQWETCQSSAEPQECLLDLSNTSNPQAFDGVNCQTGNVPSFYIEVSGPADVQAALKFSEATGVRLSVKNKGHDYKGRSSGKDTLALWTAKLNSILYDEHFVPQGCRSSATYDAVTIGAGVLVEDVYAFADSVNRTFIGGYATTIGAGGGYWLGGGHSVLSPVFGLAVDQVVEAKIVTPDGEYRVANECQNSDLLWALRGGGGSAFGVVIESTHKVQPQVTLQVADITFTPTSENTFDWYQLGVNNTYRWGLEGWGGHYESTSIVYVNPLLNLEQAKASMQPAIDFAMANNGTVTIETLPSFFAFFNKFVMSAQAGVGPEITLGTRLLPTTLFSTEEGRAALSNVFKQTLPFASPYIVAGTPFLYQYEEGSTSVTPAWRDSLWHLSISSRFNWNSTIEERTQTYQTVHDHIEAFREITPDSGAYFNEGDVYEADHTKAYWGSNYPQLLAIKRKYDPKGLLDCWQCVGWKGPQDSLYQCHIKLSTAS
ncbi:hypothetical protein CERSUDRAFT_116916 [Gelatoporia subvermispora B]|uniref:FAD-binding PCMH-type domain-containing protein n=1 Tax=Ceriporiopsis subvermispora (strain B) TaxID=914234 RepID=M2QCG7_CERS8|nr:hypothetical protein CERSUDRAFT_116916 [Gelatoporia subvermispora B]